MIAVNLGDAVTAAATWERDPGTVTGTARQGATTIALIVTTTGLVSEAVFTPPAVGRWKVKLTAAPPNVGVVEDEVKVKP